MLDEVTTGASRMVLDWTIRAEQGGGSSEVFLFHHVETVHVNGSVQWECCQEFPYRGKEESGICYLSDTPRAEAEIIEDGKDRRVSDDPLSDDGEGF